MFDLHTHCGVLNFPAAIAAYITSEISLGQVAGPFNEPHFANGFVVTPLNMVAKHDSHEQRVIVNLSWPCGTSVNDEIPSGYFFDKLLKLSYSGIDAIITAIFSLG